MQSRIPLRIANAAYKKYSRSSSSSSSSSSSRTQQNVLGGTSLCPKAKLTFQTWHEAVNTMMEENDDDGAMFTKLRSRMHQDCKFFPPTYYNHWEGGDETMVLLKCVSEVFGRSFQYNRQFLSDNGRDWCLEFEADIDQDPKARLQGVDLVKLDEEGMIIEFRVLARPPNAVAALKKVMVPKVVAPMAAMKAKKALGLLL